VKFELLRKEPTQFGVSYPKFYAWVWIMKNKSILNQGAVRLAAVDKKYFDVTDFISSDSILKSSFNIEEVFPSLLCDKIRQFAKSSQK
jgi:hypothetical protein